ncbi:hypothetical protein MTR_6g007817 [Medicago truncatula]|uniref:Uncharacterized protein n=1 Tax=Medicago truncatula TaxID=3880 RepID=A0A072U6D4_MEDTR|nr:hypothetical protein MTR_6g007817 [Medicago truncatula]
MKPGYYKTEMYSYRIRIGYRYSTDTRGYVQPLIHSTKTHNLENIHSTKPNGGSWGFNWRRELFVWEQNLLRELLEGYVMSLEDDFWGWKLEEDRTFSVKSLYSKLDRREIGEEIRPEGERRVFRQIWKSGVPTKVFCCLEMTVAVFSSRSAAGRCSARSRQHRFFCCLGAFCLSLA